MCLASTKGTVLYVTLWELVEQLRQENVEL
jgi:hypothetical protein